MRLSSSRLIYRFECIITQCWNLIEAPRKLHARCRDFQMPADNGRRRQPAARSHFIHFAINDFDIVVARYCYGGVSMTAAQQTLLPPFMRASRILSAIIHRLSSLLALSARSVEKHFTARQTRGRAVASQTPDRFSRVRPFSFYFRHLPQSRRI